MATRETEPRPRRGVGVLAPGTMIAGKYRIESVLGSGGAGRVYKARNEMLARDVAVKLLRDEHADDDALVERFLREARATHMVRHPHVVDVLDVGLHGAVPYIVEELLVGEDLSDYLARKGGRLAVRAALERMLPVIDGVAHAHARGVVHRDLKPENIFLARTPDGVVPKVLDFGISKIDVDDRHRRTTAVGTLMGTPEFMAPEQIQRFSEADARADVWSLGVMLYELLAGRTPFRGADPGALFVEICTRDHLPLDAAVHSVPPELVAVVHRCLRRDPSERYPDAGALAAALRALPDAPRHHGPRLQAVTSSLAPESRERTSKPAAPVVITRGAVEEVQVPRVSLPGEGAVKRALSGAPVRESAAPSTSAAEESHDEVNPDHLTSLRPMAADLGAPRGLLRAAFACAVVTLVGALGLASRRVADIPPRPVSIRRRAPVTPVALPVDDVTSAAEAPAGDGGAQETPHPPPRHAASHAAPHDDTSPAEPALPTDSADSVVERAVDEHDEDVRACIDRGGPDARGRVSVRLVIGRGGAVRSAQPFAPASLRDVGQCLATRMRGWSLNVPDATGDSIITWPFDIDPAAED